MPGNFAIAILRRLIDEEQDHLSPAAAEAILQLHLRDADHARMGELASISNKGTLTPAEAQEYDDYIAVADLLSLWKSKARLVLKHHPSAA